MRRTTMTAIFALALCAPTLATDDIAGQMTQCMNLLPDEILAEPKIDMRVTLDDDGLVTRIDVLSYSPESPIGRSAAESAIDAVKNCQPYQQAKAKGEVLVQLPADSASDDIVVTFPPADDIDAVINVGQ